MIEPGHRYTYEGHSVIALEQKTRGVVRCRRIRPDTHWGLSETTLFLAVDKLEPEPMRYHQNQIP